MNWVGGEAELQFSLCRSATFRSRALARRGQVLMQRQDLEEDRGLPWPLCSMIAQAELTSGIAAVLRSAMRRFRRWAK